MGGGGRVELLLLLIDLLPFLVVLDELPEHLPHEVLILLGQPLALLLLPLEPGVFLLDFLLADVLEDALHLLVVLRQWKFGQRYDFEFGLGGGGGHVALLVVDHAVEVAQVVGRLEVLEAEPGVVRLHNKTIG